MVVLSLLALAVGGCVTRNTVTEEDRQGIDVSRQILVAQDVELDRLEVQVEKDLGAMTTVARLREKNDDAKRINAQLLANFKPPQKVAVYSHAEVQSLLDRMKKSHDSTFWAMLGGTILAVGGATLAIARKYGKFIPGFGPVFSALDSTLAGVEGWMQQKKAEGNPAIANELSSVLQYVHLDDQVDAFVKNRLLKVKATLPLPLEIPPPTLT
jgi:hypothetical protein